MNEKKKKNAVLKITSFEEKKLKYDLIFTYCPQSCNCSHFSIIIKVILIFGNSVLMMNGTSTAFALNSHKRKFKKFKRTLKMKIWFITVVYNIYQVIINYQHKVLQNMALQIHSYEYNKILHQDYHIKLEYCSGEK